MTSVGTRSPRSRIGYVGQQAKRHADDGPNTPRPEPRTHDPSQPGENSFRVGTADVGGLPFHRLSEHEVVAFIMARLDEGCGGWMVNPNVDVLRQVAHDPELVKLAGQADLCVADGMPVIWASRLSNQPLPQRVAGSTLIRTLCETAARHGKSVFLLGASPDVAECCRERLQREIEGLEVVGTCSPPVGFERDSKQDQVIYSALNKKVPDIVFCAFGFPKQEKLMALLSQLFPHSWFIGSGASLDFVSGRIRRAPRWMQASGLEWAYRLKCEPRRLFRRYLVNDLPFAVHLLLLSAVRGWRQRASASRTTERPRDYNSS